MKDFLNFKLMDKADDLGGAQPSEPAEPETEEPDKPKAKYTDEDVDNIVKAKLAKEREKTAARVEEAAKLAKMNADQKKEYEAEQAIKRAEEAESKLACLEMQAEARTMVSDLGVSLTDEDLALVVTTDADSTKANVSQLTDLIGRIQDQVKTEMLKGATPKASGQSITVATADDFSKMSTTERVTFARENPEKFKEYTGGL
ncbi:DUF4355 domain-containing protein (plasmid) [Lactobacillus curvatus]|nr:DUF4355 domain-containing protein [Latilactobacillus curvatus]MSD84720.1 DUF4355 domain-containing protein [Latilactobacillus curvatus]MSE23456.1 DUF4355 domain-containing protein [Latilactobacillus curvatus]MSE24920.1 DUF4355 domain-containing protein [Latilactobacillus curvatus]